METRLKRHKQAIQMGKSPKKTHDTWKPSILAEIKQQHNCPSQTQMQEKYKFKMAADKMMRGENRLMNSLVKSQDKHKYVEYLKRTTLQNGPKGKGECFERVGATRSNAVGELLDRKEGVL